MQTETKQGRLKTLILKDGNLHLSSPTGALPKSLIEANEAATKGKVQQATRLLNDKVKQVVLEIIEQDPSRTDIMLALGMLFKQTRQINKAKELFEKILQHEKHPLVYNELGYICQCMGQLSQAIKYQTKAVEADDNNAQLLANLAKMLMVTGKIQEGIKLFRQAVETEPTNAEMHSNFLFNLHYLPKLDPQMLFEEHKRWGRIHAPASLAKVFHSNAPDPDRRLRIGYISPDFCMHSVAYTFEPLLDGHNRDVVEVFGYGNVKMSGTVTERLKQKFDHYRNIYGMDDESVVGLIEEDQVDILVNLGGHVSNNRLLVMAYKPAPIQVDYLGANTTGMQAIDYRLTDTLTDPTGSQKFYTEELVFLPKGYICYRPHDSASPVVSSPALRKGYITFGSFNNSSKVNPFTIALWAEVLKANSKSRLLLKFGGGADNQMREYYFRQFEQLGISRDRVAIYGWKLPDEHLKMYGEVDIALDTYPYNGGITTSEGLWMGVPVISLVGKCSVSRAGLVILSYLGLELFTASTPEEYVAKATALAGNLEALEKIRASMRERMVASVLFDAKGLAHRVETAYRKMWQQWCRDRNKQSM
jgi:predicted O-linked N-acetylglucosamine transferase (SPINDLY family)